MSVKARFWVQKCTRQAVSGGAIARTVELAPVVRATPLPGSDGNTDWSKYTPSGRIEMNITAEGAGEWFEERVGKDIAISFDDPDPVD
jgi:hypothetical protein